MTSADNTSRLSIKTSDEWPLLRTLNRQMQTALEAFLPRGVSVQLAESYCAGPAGGDSGKPAFLRALTFDIGDLKINTFFSGKVEKPDADPLCAAIPAGMAGAAALLQNFTTDQLTVTLEELDLQDWRERLYGHKHYLFTRWRIRAGSAVTELLQAVPDAFFLAVAHLICEPAAGRENEEDDPAVFLAFLRHLETALAEAYPGGVPGAAFQTALIFMGGQCAEVKRHVRVADLFALGPGDLQALLGELRKRRLFETFLLACAGCLPTARAALRKTMSVSALEEFLDKASKTRQSAALSTRMRAAERILVVALEWYQAGQLNPPPALRAKLDASRKEQNAPALFDADKALQDLAALLQRMSPPDLQYALPRLPRPLLTRALTFEKHISLHQIHALVRANTAAVFWEALLEDLPRSGQAADKADALSPTHARLAMIDAIHAFAAQGKISETLYAADADWVSDDIMKSLLKSSCDIEERK